MLRADGFQTREGANALGDQRVREDDRAGVAEPAVGDGSKRLAAARGPERVRGDEARELASRDGRRGGGFGRGVFGRERRRRVDVSAAVAPFAVETRAGVAPRRSSARASGSPRGREGRSRRRRSRRG